MRNLKKLIAVIMTIAILASFMVPALAEGVGHEADALKLQQIKLMAGTAADLNLDESMTRIQGLTFAIRAAGKEAAALALTDAEVATILADVVDADKIPDWNGNGKKYVAYAVKEKYTSGINGAIAPKIEFGSLNLVKGAELLTWIMKIGMGYTDVTTANASAKAYAAKIVSIDDAFALNDKELIRDDAAGILFGAALNGVNVDGKKLIDSLIAAGAVDAAAAAEAGFTTPVVSKIEVKDITTTGLKTAVVTFNKAFDKDTVTTTTVKATVGGADRVASLVKADDNLSVTIVLSSLAQGEKLKVEVNGVKDADKNEIKDYSKEIVVYDTTLPTVKGVTVVNAKTIEVNFSEPMNVLPNGQTYDARVFDDLLFGTTKAVGTVTVDAVKTKMTLTLNTALAAGDYQFSVGPRVDYAGYSTITTVFPITVVADTTAPTVVKVTADTKNKVVVEFDENIQAGVGTFNIKGTDYGSGSFTVDGKKATITVAPDLTAGDAFIDVKLTYKGIKDVLGNAVDSTTGKTFLFRASNDTVAPTATITVNDDNTIKVVFSEVVQSFTNSDFTLKNKDNNNVGVNPAGPATTDNITYTISLQSPLIDPANYTLKILNTVKDNSVMQNTMAEASIVLAMKDLMNPTVTGVPTVVDTNTARITFSEPMDATTLANKANYLYATSTASTAFVSLSTKSDVVVTVASDNKSVDIKVPGLVAQDVIKLLALKDAGGTLISLTDMNAARVVSGPTAFGAGDITAKVTAPNTIEITAANGHTFKIADANGFRIKEGSTAPSANLYVAGTAISTDGTKVTLTLSANLKKNATFDNTNAIKVYVADGAAVKDAFNTPLVVTSTAAISVADAMKPVVTVATGDATGQIKISFDELITAAGVTTSSLALDLIVRDKDGNILDITTSAAAGAGYIVTGDGTTTAPGAILGTGFNYIVVNNLTTGDNYTVTLLSRGLKDMVGNVVTELAATTVPAK